MMPKRWKRSSIKSSEYSVGDGEEAGAKIIDAIGRMDGSEKQHTANTATVGLELRQ